MRRLLILACIVGWATAPPAAATANPANPANELTGLWEAKRRFGPDVRGALLIKQSNGVWRAAIAGYSATATLAGDAITFELPDGQNAFRGKFVARHTKIVGHWIQSKYFASPVTLIRDGPDQWRGNVLPCDETFTLYLMVKVRDDGSAGAFLRNPERNVGRYQYPVDHIEREGESVKLFAANKGAEKGRLLAQGRYDSEQKTLSIYFPSRGGTFDFRRVGANETSDFYPRGRPTTPYVYTPPPALPDGWLTASVEDVGISRAGVQKFVQMITDTPIDSIGAPEIHGVLIARHGKLVLEEYFHGEHRGKPHDIRSATKSWTSTLVGAAIKAGVPLKLSSPVYQVMNGGVFPPDLEPRKKALTVENLLTQSSGLDCDDNDDNSPGAEDFVVNESGEPDYYKYTMALKMIRNPGEKAVYCSIQPHLAGGVLSRAAKQSLPMLFQNLIAEPLQIRNYYLTLTPTGDAYMGGSARFLPRDFLKLGQLLLNDGTWNGRKILTPEFSRRATSPMFNMESIAYNWRTNRMELGALKYGYLWWIVDYPYKGRTVRAFFAGGNGGQIVLTIPALDLVIAFYGGNYNDRAGFAPQWIYVPQYILPVVDN